MKYYLCLFAVFFALLVFSCGEVSDSGDHGAYCNGMPYKTSEKFCFEDVLYILCDGVEYDPNAFGCIDNKLSPMCSGTPYDITNSFCSRDIIYPLCGGEGGEIYSPNMEGCLDGKIYPKCDETLYDSTRSFCFEKKIYFLCAGKPYNPNDKGCLEGKESSVCGTSKIPYDDGTSFCFENAVYFKCKGENYFPTIEDCFNEKLYPICGPSRTPYESSSSFCFDNVIYSKCGGEKYFPNLEFCFESKIEKKCKDKPYNINNEFCFENAIYSKCNGKNYNPTTQLCFNNIETKCPNSKYDDEFCRTNAGVTVSYRICGSESYESAGKFCFNNEIYNKCGNKEYNPSKEFCYDNDYYPKCGGNMYSPRNDFCFGDKVYTKCENDQNGQNGKTYNPKESFCYKNKIDTLCNGVEFKTDEEFCSRLYDFKVHPICNGNKDYNPKEKICYNNTLYWTCPSGEFSVNQNCSPLSQICGNAIYDVSSHFCDEKIIYQKCGGKTYDNPSNKFCWPSYSDPGGQAIDKCRVQTGVNDFGQPTYSYLTYNYDTQFCSGDGIKDRNLTPICPGLAATQGCCFGTKYEIAGPYFCDNEILYPKCGDEKYNPNDQGCFEGKIYKKCSLPDVVGPCVDNTLRRCRQYGSSPNQTIDPLPGVTWECSEVDGKIEGHIKEGIAPDGNLYKIVQIGNQVWLAEDLAVGLNDWATSMTIDPSNNSAFHSFPSNVPWPGPCPDGFYVPSDEDWKKLVDYAGGAAAAGSRLKSTTGWSDKGDGLDSYGFNALPKGYENQIVGPTDVGSRAMWWSLTQPLSNNVRNASYWTIISADAEVRNHNQDKALHKAYVRCLHY
ncbi:hypothetical protein R83H12_01245 [Fibrobacteria bacterium R8-3-H12]